MNFTFVFQKYFVLLRLEIRAGCGAVGSALRSGRRGRRFESCHPDFEFHLSFPTSLFLV
jgi:hypothetical protein